MLRLGEGDPFCAQLVYGWKPRRSFLAQGRLAKASGGDVLLENKLSRSEQVTRQSCFPGSLPGVSVMQAWDQPNGRFVVH